MKEPSDVLGRSAPCRRASALYLDTTWKQVVALGLPMLLLLWACYADGAFLEPARMITAAAAPGLGLVWTVVHRRGKADRTACERPRWGAAEALLLSVAGLGALSTLWSLDWPASLQEAGLLAGAVFYLRLGRNLGRSPSARSSVLLLVSEVGVLLSLLSIVGYARHLSWLTQDLGGKILPTGTFGYANALAGFLFLSLAATVALFTDPGGLRLGTRVESASGRSQSRPALFAAAVILQVAAIVLTQSRAAAAVAVLLPLLVAGVRFVGDPRRGVKRWLVVGLVLLFVGVVVALGVVFWERLRPYLSTADTFRLQTWRAGLQATGQSPILGHGLGTFYLAYAPFKPGGQTTYAHNILVQYLVELGVVGAALIAAFLAVAVLRPLKTFLGPLTSPRFPLLLGLQAFVTHNLVDLTWYFPALLLTFSLLLGVMSSYPSDFRNRMRPDHVRQHVGRIQGRSRKWPSAMLGR
ncbi:MAG: O-antigen ligase family protein [Actinomycetia bacterium]|nr:O-antigen ligase family protein [Actinomycetes bacterium]